MMSPDLILAAGFVVAALTLNAIVTVWRTLKMSQSLDNLTAAVSALEVEAGTLGTAVNTAVTEIGSLKAGPDSAALDGLTTRVNAVASTLTAAASALTAA